MYIAEVRLETQNETDEDAELIDILTSAWRSNGQALGCEYPCVLTDRIYRTLLMLPLADSLAEQHDSKYVTSAKLKLEKAGFESPSVTLWGEDPFSAEPCTCSNPSYFILYTTYVALESCLRCGDCFGKLPLYLIPLHVMPDGELHDKIMSWQSDYKSCDHLQMNCATGEKFGLREISNHDSSLSKRGRETASGITDATGTSTYYYLHRYRGTSMKPERSRRCPSCGGE